MLRRQKKELAGSHQCPLSVSASLLQALGGGLGSALPSPRLVVEQPPSGADPAVQASVNETLLPGRVGSPPAAPRELSAPADCPIDPGSTGASGPDGAIYGSGVDMVRAPLRSPRSSNHISSNKARACVCTGQGGGGLPLA